MSVALTCGQCGGTFVVPPSRVGVRRHCSRACADAEKSARMLAEGCPWSVPKVEIACQACGRTKLVNPSQTVGSKGRFCSRACANAKPNRRRGDKVPCTGCGALVKKRTGTARRRRFCGKECYARWVVASGVLAGDKNPAFNSREVPCAHCGTRLVRQAARVESTTEQFCDLTCYAAWQSAHRVREASPRWRGGAILDYGPDWRAQRRRARKRDGHRCQLCGRTRETLGREPDVHHIIPFRDFGFVQGENENYREANRLENLVCLCRPCHGKVENGRLGLLDRPYLTPREEACPSVVPFASRTTTSASDPSRSQAVRATVRA